MSVHGHPKGVRSFSPRPKPKAGSPAPPTGFSPLPSAKGSGGAPSAPQPAMAAVPKGNPAKKGDGSKNFVTTKSVNGGPKGGLARVPGNKDVIPADVRSFSNLPR